MMDIQKKALRSALDEFDWEALRLFRLYPDGPRRGSIALTQVELDAVRELIRRAVTDTGRTGGGDG